MLTIYTLEASGIDCEVTLWLENLAELEIHGSAIAFTTRKYIPSRVQSCGTEAHGALYKNVGLALRSGGRLVLVGFDRTVDVPRGQSCILIEILTGPGCKATRNTI